MSMFSEMMTPAREVLDEFFTEEVIVREPGQEDRCVNASIGRIRVESRQNDNGTTYAVQVRYLRLAGKESLRHDASVELPDGSNWSIDLDRKLEGSAGATMQLRQIAVHRKTRPNYRRGKP